MQDTFLKKWWCYFCVHMELILPTQLAMVVAIFPYFANMSWGFFK